MMKEKGEVIVKQESAGKCWGVLGGWGQGCVYMCVCVWGDQVSSFLISRLTLSREHMKEGRALEITPESFLQSCREAMYVLFLLPSPGSSLSCLPLKLPLQRLLNWMLEFSVF